MCPDEVPSSQGAAETEFASQNSGSHDPSQTASVIAGTGGMGAFDSKEVKHRTLRFKDGTTTNCANLDGWHGNTDLEIAVVAVMCQSQPVLSGVTDLLSHNRYAAAALHVLSGILSGS